MHEHVERDERDQDEVQPLGQLGFLQLNGEEYCHDGDDMGQITSQPVQPVEQGSPLSAGMWTEVSTNRLQETEHRRHHAQNGMWIINLGPAPDFHKNNNKSSHGQGPGANHQESMPLKTKTNLFSIAKSK